MKNSYSFLALVFGLLITGCNKNERPLQSGLEQARTTFLTEQEAGEKSILTQRQAFLGFILYSKPKEVRAHLIKLVKQKKLAIPPQFGNKPCELRDDLLDNVSYSFNVFNLRNIDTPIKFTWHEDRLKAVSGEIKSYASDWINLQIVKAFEDKLGPSKTFYITDASKCHYWIKGGQEVLLIFPLKDNPKFIYTALAPTQEFIDEQKKNMQEKITKDSTAAAITSKDL